MNTTDELGVRLWAIMASIKALKKSLTPDRLDIYDASIEEAKQKFVKRRPDISREFLERIDELLP